MSKRWAALPRGTRWLLGGIGAVVLAVVVAWVLFVPAADWLAHHDVGTARGSLLQTARDDARGRLLTLGAGLVAAGALIFTALNFNLLRRNSEQADQWQRRTYELTEQGQVTDRYTKAIEQIGSDKLDVRIGGIYALERIARDSSRDHPTVMEVLTAFIREHSQEQWLLPHPPVGQDQERSTRPDVQAAVTVVGRRDASGNVLAINLARADLTGANLREVNLEGANLEGAILKYANLRETILADADLTDADLTLANLLGADLAGAWLYGTIFDRANLAADLTEVRSLYAAKLAGAVLDAATWPVDVPVPEGWKRGASGRWLERTDTGSGLTGAS